MCDKRFTTLTNNCLLDWNTKKIQKKKINAKNRQPNECHDLWESFDKFNTK